MLFERDLLDKGLAGSSELEAIRAEVARDIDTAEQFSLASAYPDAQAFKSSILGARS
jgi:TPP-dependent pyruvate/acetoin dehydrogenase alpha subunit